MNKYLHTFVICAYKESEYLEECIESLINQTLKSKLIIATSTPNAFIDGISKKYDIPVFVNEGEGGITQDWNFGLSKIETKLATIAHQDDVYESDYTAEFIKAFKGSKKPLIAFSDYGEVRNGVKTTDVKMLKIKRIMLFPMKLKLFKRSRFVRRRILSVGDPICCPSVMFAIRNLELPIFENHFMCCEDWEAWEKISRKKGDFIYISKPLMYHRIHEESTTSKALETGERIDENYKMFCKFWPRPIARLINKVYTKSEESNEL